MVENEKIFLAVQKNCFPIGLVSHLEKTLPPSAANLCLLKTLLKPQHQREDSIGSKTGQTHITIYVFVSIRFSSLLQYSFMYLAKTCPSSTLLPISQKLLLVLVL